MKCKFSDEIAPKSVEVETFLSSLGSKLIADSMDEGKVKDVMTLTMEKALAKLDLGTREVNYFAHFVTSKCYDDGSHAKWERLGVPIYFIDEKHVTYIEKDVERPISVLLTPYLWVRREFETKSAEELDGLKLKCRTSAESQEKTKAADNELAFAAAVNQDDLIKKIADSVDNLKTEMALAKKEFEQADEAIKDESASYTKNFNDLTSKKLELEKQLRSGKFNGDGSNKRNAREDASMQYKKIQANLKALPLLHIEQMKTLVSKSKSNPRTLRLGAATYSHLGPCARFLCRTSGKAPARRSTSSRWSC